MNLLSYVHLRNIYGSTGGGRVARNIVEALGRRNDVEQRILGDANDHRQIVEKVGEPWTGYEYHLFGRDTSAQQRRWLLGMGPVAEEFWPEADWLYCTGESYVPTRKMRSAVVMHDAAYFDDTALVHDRRYFLQQMKWRLLFARLDRNADMIHTVSAFSAERIAHHFPGLRDRIRVVHNGVTERFFDSETADDAALIASAGLHGNNFILLPRGLSFRKNAELVLAAWPILRRRHPDLRLVVTSHNSSGYVDRARGSDPDLITPGFVSDQVLAALYRQARLVWFPSRYEGFGIPVLEAMASGTAVVASNATSLPEVAGGAAMLVNIDDPLAHVEAIDTLLTNEAERARWRKAGRARAASFTWDKAAEALTTAMRGMS
ncbi:glycosyltransferase family 1 protein [Phenylobacterium sp.]|uniref:glycosyltransferase family 4 protein n=1 Tax=Phenylobacterium sp. TaxID=1871053 RepID=UPI00271AF760|nr:glycosyltransferase family 1 protein [Phenylobacterium sp.]MDO8801634.1 glycosyltransferase family 1 protein [Phenylobacterium sp.]